MDIKPEDEKDLATSSDESDSDSRMADVRPAVADTMSSVSSVAKHQLQAQEGLGKHEGVLCERCGHHLRRPRSVGLTSHQCDGCSKFFEYDRVVACESCLYSLCEPCCRIKIEEIVAPVATRIMEKIDTVAASKMFKKTRAVVVAVEGKQLLYSFRCLLCDRLAACESEQSCEDSDSDDDDDDDESAPKDSMESRLRDVKIGDVIVACPVPGCGFVLCERCAEFVVSQRIRARKLQPTEMPVSLQVTFATRYNNVYLHCWCCGEYHEPRYGSTLAWLEDGKACLSLCLRCAKQPGRLESELEKKKGEQDKDFALFAKWEAYAIKQQQLFEKNFPVRSILHVPQLDVCTEAFLQLELMVHESSKMPLPIVFEVEVAVSKRKMDRLSPIMRRLLQECRWPMHTALQLLKHAKDAQRRYVQTAETWRKQVEQLSKLSIEMLDRLDRPEYLRRVILNPRPNGHNPPKSLIGLALDAEHHEFLAHRSVQLTVMQRWVTPIRGDETFSTTTFILSRLLLWMIGVFMHLVGWFAGGKLRRRLKYMKERQTSPLLSFFFSNDKSQTHTLEYFTVSPSTAFTLYIVFFGFFVVLVSYTATQTSTTDFTINEVLIIVWIIGLLLVEVSQVREMGWDYFGSFWNTFDIVHLTTYLSLSAVKLSAVGAWTHESQDDKLLEAYDCLLAVAVFMTYMRALYVCIPTKTLGPLLVAFGSMLTDVMVWVVIMLVIITGLSLSLLKLFIPQEVMPVAVGDALGFSTDPSSAAAPSSLGPSGAEGGADIHKFGWVFVNFVWGMTNMPTFDGSAYSVLNVDKLVEVKQIVAEIFIVFFMIFATIVLINLLIAVMNSTYARITDDSDREHKASRADMVEDFCDSSPVPPPINIVTNLVIPAMEVSVRVLRSLPRQCCACACCVCPSLFRESSPWSNPEPGLVVDSVHKHTSKFMLEKSLSRARSAEAALRSKLIRLLNSLEDDDDYLDTLRERVRDLSSRVITLRRLVAKRDGIITVPTGKDGSGSPPPEAATAASATEKTAAAPPFLLEVP
eukprot:m51a1_g12345 putative protein trp- isoform a (1032) ;mRNA; r:518905-522745